jgi:hypothetical protein
LREQRQKQLDWLATKADIITSQSHSRFAILLVRAEENFQVENGIRRN